MANILIIMAPFTGHVTPSLFLAAALTKRGHRVVYVNEEKWAGRIADAGAELIPYIDYPKAPGYIKELRTFFGAAFRTVLQTNETFDLLIYDMFFYIGEALAERLGIPAVRLLLQPAWNEEIIRGFTQTRADRKVSERTNRDYNLLDFFALSGRTARELGVAKHGLISSGLRSTAALNIVNTIRSFQPGAETFDSSYYFTPLTRVSMAQSTEVAPGIPFPDIRHPLVYISCGSMVSSRGLLKNTIKAFAGKPYTLIVSCSGGDPHKLGTLPEQVFAYSYVNQPAVLSRADLFITHGGMNSVNEALAFGVPMLVYPMLNDQPVNARITEGLGIGKTLHKKSPKEIYGKSAAILGDPEIRSNILKMKDSLRNDAGISGAADRIEKLVPKRNL